MMSRPQTATSIHQRLRQQLKAGKYTLNLGDKTLIMGVVNLTSDSFSGDGVLSLNKQIKQIKSLIAQGADIIDIGAESSRPGSKEISASAELKRIVPLLKKLRLINIPISVDTYKAQVAEAVLDQGVSIINNIKGSQLDSTLLKVLARYNAGIVLMHMRGSPEIMQKNIQYKNVVNEVSSELRRSIEKCLEFGIKANRIIIDPGIGFSKDLSHNLEIIHYLNKFKKLGCPLLIGTSRKSFIGKITGKEVSDRLWGTAASVALSVAGGADIIRVHDVAAMKDVVMVADAIINQQRR